VEILCETLLIYLTGGVSHIVFALFYFITIVTAALLISERAGLLCASSCSVALAINAGAYFLAIEGYLELPLVADELLDVVALHWNSVISNLVQISVSMHVVAYLVGRLPYRVTGGQILYEEILSQIREAVIAIDNAGRVAYVNKEALQLFNWTEIPHLIGRRFPEILSRDEDRRLLEILTVGTDIHGEVELPIRNGTTLPIEVKITVLYDGRGSVRGVVGVFSDLTLKRQMRRAEYRLERFRGIEEMSIGIAHEIRNPLASIRGAMQELGRRAFVDEDDRTLAAIVLKESDRLDAILDTFMGYARMKPVLRSNVDILALTREIIVLLKCREDAKSVEISLDCASEKLLMSLDIDKIKQVLINIGVNALQALEGQGSLRFHVKEGQLHRQSEGLESRVYMETQAVEICIEDNGPGVDRDIEGKLFTPFFSSKSQGTGLGLALAQKIIDAHGGDVSFEPLEPKGSRFKIKLPHPQAEDSKQLQVT
jgi:PAS domain S-box-containing protein